MNQEVSGWAKDGGSLQRSADFVRHTTDAWLVQRRAAPILGTMPVEIVIPLFVLLIAGLCVLVRWEFRRLIRAREARMLERLHSSQF